MKIKNIMKEKKNKKIKADKSVEDSNEIRAFIIIVVVIAILIGCIYGLTEILKNDEPVNDTVAGEINYDVVTVGTMLNRPYNEYYVLVFNGEDSNAALYSTIMSNYMQKSSDKDYIKIFYCDLDNKLNESYYNVNDDDKSNPNAIKIDDFDFGNLTLVKIKNGQVSKYIEDLDKIRELLK